MAGLQTNQGIKVAIQERVHLDDMAGAYRIVCDGSGVFPAFIEVHTAKYVFGPATVRSSCADSPRLRFLLHDS